MDILKKENKEGREADGLTETVRRRGITMPDLGGMGGAGKKTISRKKPMC